MSFKTRFTVTKCLLIAQIIGAAYENARLAKSVVSLGTFSKLVPGSAAERV